MSVLNRAILVVAAVVTTAACVLATDPEPRVTVHVAGRVVDASGAPIAGASVATTWTLDASGRVGAARLTADEAGRFAGEVEARGGALVLTSFSPDGKLAGWTTLDPARRLDRVVIELGPAVQVRGRVLGDGEWVHAAWTLRPSKAVVARSDHVPGTFRLTLPAGDYTLMVHDGRGTLKRRHVDLRRVRTKRVPTLNLAANFLARNKGKPMPPWHVTARNDGIEGTPRLEDYRGRWVLVHFWRFDSAASIAATLPDLVRFQRSHASTKVEVLTFHDSSVASTQELSDLLADVRRKYWNDEPLPFPVFLDDTGETFEAWGVDRVPTTVVIDPEGRLVGRGGLDLLKRAAKEAAQKKARSG